ncbi:ABC transporter permease [Paraflavitalea speifideaquila]|uniref:ABC transporter permease n=1 Tax=Paraflavitalea speifideaquila TaxID=3076558 RepID=UPI0028E7011B|nr:ABC transporter permease [Paraflavitalea speifideiaquila]
MHAIVADENFAHTFGLQVRQGNFFTDYRGSSAQNQLVLNETAARILGITTINQTVRMPGETSLP